VRVTGVHNNQQPGDLEAREGTHVTVLPPWCAAPAAGRRPKGRSRGPGADRSLPPRLRNLTGAWEASHEPGRGVRGVSRTRPGRESPTNLAWGVRARRTWPGAWEPDMPAEASLVALVLTPGPDIPSNTKKTLPDASLRWGVILYRCTLRVGKQVQEVSV
jgi:hypothetical protein